MLHPRDRGGRDELAPLATSLLLYIHIEEDREQGGGREATSHPQQGRARVLCHVRVNKCRTRAGEEKIEQKERHYRMEGG